MLLVVIVQQIDGPFALLECNLVSTMSNAQYVVAVV